MITIRQNIFVDYNDIENVSEKVVYYPKIFSEKILQKTLEKLKTDKYTISTCLSYGLVKLTNRVFSHSNKNENGSISLYCTKNHTLEFKNKINQRKITFKAYAGSVIILGNLFRKEWLCNSKESYKHFIIFYQLNPLSSIYLSISDRLKYGNKIKKLLSNITSNPIGKQCVDMYLDKDNMLGSGCYGNVYRTMIDNKRFALKLSKLKPEALKDPFGKDSSSWFEVRILENIIKPLLKKTICPNLPLIMDKMVCDNCQLNIKGEKDTVECVITAVELASGDLKHYLQKYQPSEKELNSCLFQIMAGLHAIQLYGQIMNYDIKKENILYYTVEKGGYWHYKIHGKNFYVPNYGQLFVINDFGISRTMSPKFPMYKTAQTKLYRLGSRYAIVKNGRFHALNVSNQSDKKGELVKADRIVWSDGNVSLGAQFSMKRNGRVVRLRTHLNNALHAYLQKKNISSKPNSHNFFLHPEIIPPFEFFNDTQDVIRMFIGGKRTTQRGYHGKYDRITKDLYKKLNKYNNKLSESMKDRKFSNDPAQVLAGYFLTSFFTNVYSKKPKNANKIETYILS